MSMDNITKNIYIKNEIFINKTVSEIIEGLNIKLFEMKIKIDNSNLDKMDLTYKFSFIKFEDITMEKALHQLTMLIGKDLKLVRI